jgi:two-component system, sensor histidine kinase and response regulator
MRSETILVVEDDPAVLDVLKEMLETAGFRVATGKNGVQGLAALAASRPDLVISDISMPEMDGYRFYEAVRAHAQWVGLPFIFLTGKGDDDEIREGRRLGVDDYLVKPVREADLLVAVRARLDRHAALEALRDQQVQDVKRTILRTLNHELRTPLTYLAGYAELLKELGPELSAEKIRLSVDGILAGSQRLVQLVEDLVLLVDLQTGAARSTWERERRRIEDLPVLLAQLAEREGPRAQTRNVTVRADLAPLLPCVVGQAELLLGAVSRLVDNAIKFSKKSGGEVVLSARPGGHGVVLEVRDTGIGMPAEELDRISEMFYQIDRATLEQRGSGVGLTIVRGIVSLHGGELTVESEVGKGSTARVDLPTA